MGEREEERGEEVGGGRGGGEEVGEGGEAGAEAEDVGEEEVAEVEPSAQVQIHLRTVVSVKYNRKTYDNLRDLFYLYSLEI